MKTRQSLLIGSRCYGCGSPVACRLPPSALPLPPFSPPSSLSSSRTIGRFSGASMPMRTIPGNPDHGDPIRSPMRHFFAGFSRQDKHRTTPTAGYPSGYRRPDRRTSGGVAARSIPLRKWVRWDWSPCATAVSACRSAQTSSVRARLTQPLGRDSCPPHPDPLPEGEGDAGHLAFRYGRVYSMKFSGTCHLALLGE